MAATATHARAATPILGQDRALGLLGRSLASGRVHHAWVFSGPYGVGKCTTALAFGAALLDPEARPDPAGGLPIVDPAGETARLVAAGTHPDLHVIRKELALDSSNAQLRGRKLSTIPVDVLREHMIGGRTGDEKYHEPKVFQSAARGRRKVFIVDEADLLDQTGQNALLKTLEEPPPGTVIVLVTDRPERLLPTIHSRAQAVRFARLDDAAMHAWLDARAAATGDGVPAERRDWLLEFADGSPGTIVTALEQELHAWPLVLEPLVRDAASGRFPPAFGVTMGELVEQFAQARVKREKNASKDAANKEGVAWLLRVLAAMLRRRFRTGVDDERTLAMVEALRDAELSVAANVRPKIVMEQLAVRWSA